jgi:hypothetical protein
MLPLLACGAGIYLGLNFNVLVLVPVSFFGFGAFIFVSLSSGYGSYESLPVVLLPFISVQAGYMIGLTGRDAYGQVLARLGSAQSKRI